MRVNKRLKEKCEARNICFIDYKNSSLKYKYNRSWLYLNHTETKKSIGNILFGLPKSH